jgi:HTH-type transcriptional regulator / antitoxin MqsA
MKCPNCEAIESLRDTRDVPYTYQGKSTVLPQVTGDFCPACNESVLDAAESRRAMTLMLDFNEQVDASIVDSGFIAGMPKKLDLG